MDKSQEVIDFINSIVAKYFSNKKNKVELPLSEYYNILQGIRQILNEK